MGSQRVNHAAAAAAAVKSLQSCPTLCDPIDSRPPGPAIPGVLQARTLEWVAISFSKAWKWKVKVKSLSLVQLSDPIDCSLQGSSIHGIFQAKSTGVGCHCLLRVNPEWHFQKNKLKGAKAKKITIKVILGEVVFHTPRSGWYVYLVIHCQKFLLS